jgi:hypothetical protein
LTDFDLGLLLLLLAVNRDFRRGCEPRQIRLQCNAAGVPHIDVLRVQIDGAKLQALPVNSSQDDGSVFDIQMANRDID